jgi:hypothetical protein
MKSARIILLSLFLTLMVGCQTQAYKSSNTSAKETIAEKRQRFSFIGLVSKVKSKGCNSLTPGERQFIRLIIKTQFVLYPSDGVCNETWFNTVLIDHIDKSQSGD